MDTRELQRWVGKQWTPSVIRTARVFYYTDQEQQVYCVNQDAPLRLTRISVNDLATAWKPDPNWHPLPSCIRVPDGL